MKTTLEMAREAGIVPYIVGPTNAKYLERLKAFEALVRADERSVEREACAKVCETAEVPIDIGIWQGTKKSLSAATAMGLANAIRARGQA